MNKTPQHIAIIMDGNGRWAQKRGLPRLLGHRAGAESIRECLQSCKEFGIAYLTLYAFSSENWRRPQSEVKGLMQLLERFLREHTEEMRKEGVCLQAIGHIDELPAGCRKLLKESIEKTCENKTVTMVLALSYGSRMEIVDALKKMVRQAREGLLQENEVTPELVSQHLYTAGIPDPDLLIRTSGEMRLSNFLLWQSSYTEIYVTSKFWPDFRRPDFVEALEEYSKRVRRYGGML